MKFVIVICLLSMVLAEPPVNENYSPPKPNYNNDHGYSYGSHRSLSQEYGPPQPVSRIRNTPSAEYGLPSVKTDSKLSSSYGLPSSRISQEYGVPNTRSSLSNSLSKDAVEYGSPQLRKPPSDIYGAPNPRSGLYQDAQSYAPNRSPSSQYGAPGFRTPSEQYGLPSRTFSSTRSSQKTSLHNQFQAKQGPSQEYGLPSNKLNDISQSYSAPKTSLKPYSSRDLLQTYGAPKASQIQHNAPLADSYGVPDSIVTSDYSQDVKSVAQTYGSPSEKDLSETYGTPSEGNFEQYKAPSKSNNLKTSAVTSSYNFGRSSLSSKYGAPSVRDSMPSDHYGVPEQYNTLSNDGYGYARNSLDDHDEEPASYDFGYKVNDYISGSDFGHTESRQENRAEGTYFVVLPDGNKQVVEYEADERGFKPRISVEPVEGSAAGGYDDNAANLVKSQNGPY